MTYRKIYKLKYHKGLSTQELLQRYPRDSRQVNEVALLDLPVATLKKVLPERKALEKIKALKKKLGKKK